MQKKAFLALIVVSNLCLLNGFAQDVRYDCEQTRGAAGVTRIAILTFEDKSGKARAYGALSETITDRIIINVLNDPAATEFLTIISRDQLEQVMSEQNLSFTGRFDAQTVASIGAVVGVHELVIGQITQMVYTPARSKKTSWDRQSTIRKKTGTERYVDSEGNTKTRAKYSNVKVFARVTHTQVESSAWIIGSYKILDVKTGELKDADDFTTKHEFKAEWARFTGNEVALDRSDRALVSRPEEHAPVEDEMVLEAANQLASELAEALKAYVISRSPVPTVRIAPFPVVSPVVGENIVIKVNISEVKNVTGYRATLQFDATALRYVSSSNGNYLPEGAFFVPPVIKGNAVTLAATSLSEESAGDGTLATVTFEVIAVKASTLRLSDVLLTV